MKNIKSTSEDAIRTHIASITQHQLIHSAQTRQLEMNCYLCQCQYNLKRKSVNNNLKRHLIVHEIKRPKN